jgi:hypothetical protein
MTATTTELPTLSERLNNPEFRIAELIGQAELDRIIAALTPDDVTVTITKYFSGWVPNSYRFAKKGNCTTARVSVAGQFAYDVVLGEYDMKRSGGTGPEVVVTIAKANQSRGRNV